MEAQSEKRLGVIKSWSRFVVRELASAGRLVSDGLEISPAGKEPLFAELRALAKPHMAILVHKRAKASSTNGAVALADTRWAEELNRCADNWCRLVATGTERARLIEVLDQIVSDEQNRMATELTAIPVTSRFDTSWAI